MATVLSNDRPVVGNTYRWKLVAYLVDENGTESRWNLAGATVSFIFTKPSGTEVTVSATITDAANGVAVYDSSASFLDVSGNWTFRARVVSGTTNQKSLPVIYSVAP